MTIAQFPQRTQLEASAELAPAQGCAQQSSEKQNSAMRVSAREFCHAIGHFLPRRVDEKFRAA
jgi:hypothetical protein